MLVLGGKPIPATEWCLGFEDTGLHFDLGYAGVERRIAPVEVGVGHWTAGEAGTKRTDDDGQWVFNVLKNRKDEHGKPMPLSVEFCIGADGTLWQYADPLVVSCKHASSSLNRRSWGCEVVSAGRPPAPEGREDRGVQRRLVHGKVTEVLGFYSEQLRKWVMLATALHVALKLPLVVAAQRDRNGELVLATDRLRQGALSRWSGVVEHLHCSSTKQDAGGMLAEALLQAGWKLSEVR